MKYLLLFLILTPGMLFSQDTNCGSVIPVIVCSSNIFVCIDEESDSVSVSNTLDLPNFEYFLVDRNLPSTDDTGPAIIKILTEPTFVPSELGVEDTTTLEVIAAAYDLSAIQELVDTILLNTYGGGTPCCDNSIINFLCNRLTAAGIMEGSDITSLSAVFSLAFGDPDDLFSVDDLVSNIDLMNTLFASPLVPASCGGWGNAPEICYAYGDACIFKVTVPQDLLVLDAPQHIGDTLVIADTISSSAVVMPLDSIKYYYYSETNLSSGFEVKQGGVFEVQRKRCPDE